ncbi:MAG: hypothetical protein ACOZIN_18920 [Myxococcota bacterium]
MAAVVFEKASVLCYRLFDVAEAIDLEKARALAAEESRRLRLTRAGSEYLVLPNPPLAVGLAPRMVPLSFGPMTMEVAVHLFDFGVASVILKAPVRAGTTMEELVPLCDELYDSLEVEKAAVEVLGQMRQALAPALGEGQLWTQNESYTVVFAEKLRGEPKAEELLTHGEWLARLLLGEVGERPLSKKETLDVLEHQFSYTDLDLAVIDWNAAFVYEPSGSQDIPDLLEIANAQLLELRFFDDKLDRQLRETYTQVARKKRRFSVLRSPYSGLVRRVMVTLFEITEFIERVENSLKIVGDFYLAKVYEASVKQLRIGSWQAQVTRKQRLLAQTYSLLKGEVDTNRSHLLELTIVVLIILEVVLAFLPWKP